MMKLLPTALITLVLASLASAGLTVTDDGKYFGTDAVTQATEKLKGSPLNVVVVTAEQAPLEIRSEVDQADAAARSRLFADFAKKQAIARSADVFVYANRSPKQLRVLTSAKAHKAGVAGDDGATLTRSLLDAFKAGEFDRGLTELSSQVAAAKTAGSNVGGTLSSDAFPGAEKPNAAARSANTPAARPAQSTGFPMWLWLVIAVVAFLVIRGIFRAMSGGNRGAANPYGQQGMNPNNPNQYPPQQQGGGFGRGLMGGVLGGLLGSYLGGNVFGGQRHDSSSTGNDPSSSGNDNSTGNDSNFDSGGGDYSDSGGGDSGGGDSGGGDY